MTGRLLMAFAVFSVVGLAIDQRYDGTWKFNPAKSTSSGGPTWKSRTLTISTDGETRKFQSDGVSTDGKQVSGNYEAKMDGKDYPMTGSLTGADTIALTQKGNGPSSFTLKKGGKVISSGKTTVSKDGKTLTMDIKNVGADGKTTTAKAVYDKQ